MIILNRFILFNLLVGVSLPVYAASQVFQATVDAFSAPAMIQIENVHFGAISVADASTCLMDANGQLSGQCMASHPDISVGEIRLDGLSQNQILTLNVRGESGVALTFTPVVDLTGGVMEHTGIAEGEDVVVNVSETGDAITLTVYGEITTNQTLESGSTHNMDYTVEINFQ